MTIFISVTDRIRIGLPLGRFLKTCLILLVFITFLMMLNVVPVNAGTIQITNNNYSNREVQIDNGKIVWQSYYVGSNNVNAIFLYDTATGVTNQISSNTHHAYLPQINDGRVVWLDQEGSNDPEIFLYDIATATTTQITDNNFQDDNYDISDGKVVWMSALNNDDPEIFLYDTATGVTTQITDNSYYDYEPQIDNGKVVWYTFLNGIFLYDIATGVTTQISSDTQSHFNPQIDNGKVVWPGHGGIFLYDIATGVTTNIGSGGENLKISGGKVVWVSNREIFLYDIATAITTQITDNINLIDDYPHINDGIVAWEGQIVAFGEREIFRYDIATGVTNRITNNSYYDNRPQTDDGKIVWWGGPNSSSTIYLWDAIYPDSSTFYSIADTYVRSGQSNQNEGAGDFMRVQSSGSNRALVRIDQTALQSVIGNGEVLSAKLRLTITDNGNNWGATGRTVGAHRLIVNWVEGNGTDTARGTGPGATWNCAIDSLIENLFKNCSGSTEWEMGKPNNPSVHPWIEAASDTQTITNNQTGVLEYDVTSDVAGFLNGTSQNYGWIIKKTAELQSGQVSFGTKESSSIPQLIVSYQL